MPTRIPETCGCCRRATSWEYWIAAWWAALIAEHSLHLGKAEAKDSLAELEQKWEQLKKENPAIAEVEGNLKTEWEALETKLADLKEKHAPVREAVEEVSQDVGAAFGLVGDELKRGYERLRKLL